MQKLFLLFEKFWGKSNKYFLALILLTVPLYPKFPFLTVPGTQVAIRLEDFILALASVFWFLGNIRNLLSFKKDPLKRAILLFWAITFLSTLSAIFLTQTVSPLLSLLHWGRRIEYMSVFLFLLDSNVRKQDLAFYIRCLIVVFLYSFVVGFGQKYLQWPIITTQNAEYSKGLALQYLSGGHLVSTFAGHYDMASFIILASPLLFAAVLYDKTLLYVKNKATRIMSITVTVLVILAGLWLLTNAASRISIISYAGAVSLTLILIRKIKIIPIFLALVFLFSITSGSLIGRYENILDVIVKKVHAQEVLISTPEPTPPPPLEDRSTNIRLAVEWPRALRALTKNPLLGTGYSSITLATDNDYLRSLGEVGILGTMSFGLVLILVFAAILKGFFSSKTWTTKKLLCAALMGAIPGIFLNLVFIDLLEASKFAILFWFFLGLTIAHLRSSES